MLAEQFDVVAAGRIEASRMKQSVSAVSAGTNVTMDAGQFVKLADLIASLCEIAASTPRGLSDPQYWVPLPEYVKLKRKLDEIPSGSIGQRSNSSGRMATLGQALGLDVSEFRPGLD